MESPITALKGVRDFNDLLQRTDSYGYPLILWTSERMRWRINSAEELKTKLDELSITMVRHLMNGKTVVYLQRMYLEPCKKKRKSKYPSSNGVFPRWKQEARFDAVS